MTDEQIVNLYKKVGSMNAVYNLAGIGYPKLKRILAEAGIQVSKKKAMAKYKKMYSAR